MNPDYHKRLRHLFSNECVRDKIIIHVWKILNGLTPNDLGLSFGDSKSKCTCPTKELQGLS